MALRIFISSNNMEKITNNHTTHMIGYHIIFCPKYRNMLSEVHCISLRKCFYEIAEEYNWHIESLEVASDHIHLFVQANPTDSPVDISKTFKSISAIFLFTQYPKLKERKFWGSGLWSRGTYYSTVGKVDEEIVKEYIESHSSHRTSL